MRSLKVFRCLLLTLLTLVLSAQVVLADLSADIRQILSDKVLTRAVSGIQVVKLSDKSDGCQILYERNSHTPLATASNMKVITTSSALHTLTPDFRFQTVLLKQGNDLVIWGDGDPTLGDAELMDKYNVPQTTVYDDWIAQINKLGITRCENILVDDSIFDTEFLHPRWGKHQFERFGSELGGLNFNTNILDFDVQARKNGPVTWVTRPATNYVHITSNTCLPGRNRVILARSANSNDVALSGSVENRCAVGVTIHDPSLFAATVFADLLKSRRVAVTGEVKRDRTIRQRYAATTDTNARNQQWQVVFISKTPIEAVVNHCNKKSINLYAEALCKRQAVAATGTSGTWTSGTAVTANFLKQLGVPEAEFQLDDGSGLSRENYITANAMVRVLIHDYYSPAKGVFLKSLPIGGVDGTLGKRFDPSLHGRVFAKTGFIANVSALSGYIHARSGDWFAFSILMNDIPDFSNGLVKPLQDRIVKAIDNASVAEE